MYSSNDLIQNSPFSGVKTIPKMIFVGVDKDANQELIHVSCNISKFDFHSSYYFSFIYITVLYFLLLKIFCYFNFILFFKHKMSLSLE